MAWVDKIIATCFTAAAAWLVTIVVIVAAGCDGPEIDPESIGFNATKHVFDPRPTKFSTRTTNQYAAMLTVGEFKGWLKETYPKKIVCISSVNYLGKTVGFIVVWEEPR